MKTTHLLPLEDRVLIEADPAPEKLGGLELSDAHKKKHQLPQGTVIAVGEGKQGINYMPLVPGDRVMYGGHANMEIEDPITHDKFLCMRLTDVFIKIQGEELGR